MALDQFKKIKSVKVSGMDLEKFKQSLRRLAETEILVGVPATNASRPDAGGITNAAIGYIAEFGAPERNIPARPWLMPVIRDEQDKIGSDLGKVANLVLRGSPPAVIDRGLHAVGIRVVADIKGRITTGLEPPLADSTLYSRASRGDEGAAWELAWRRTGVADLNGQLAKPYILTGNFLKSITYVLAGRRRNGP